MGKMKFLLASVLTAATVVPVAALKSQEDAARTDTAHVDDAEFVSLLQRGPASDDELGLVVRTLVEHERQSEAVQVLVDYLLRDDAELTTNAGTADRQCAFCSGVLDSRGPGMPGPLVATVHAAFDEIEKRAYDANDGDLMMRLADISRATHDSFNNRGLYYLLEAFRIGNLDDDSKLAAVSYLNDMGWYAQAKSLVDQLHTDPTSALYQSGTTRRWATYLDSRIDFSSKITARLLGADSSANGEEYLPLVKVAPYYPQEAAAQGREGSVVVEFTVTQRGRTKDVTVVSSTDSIFDEAAVWAASRFLYLPRLEGGTPVELPGVRNKITFVLEQEG